METTPAADGIVATGWDEEEYERAGRDGALAQRVYTARLLGRDSALTLHGGGNVSVKATFRDPLGPVDALYVKASGFDLATIGESGFVPLSLSHVLAVAELEELTDLEMARQLKLAALEPDAPAASVEALLHGIVPARFVDHTHPDALLSVMNTPSGRERIRDLYGDRVVVVPYVRPGFPLARLAAEIFATDAHAGTVGIVLMHHGLFTFGATARESYERTIELVAGAEEYLRARDAWHVDRGPRPTAHRSAPAVADLRRAISRAAGRPLVLVRDHSAAGARFAARDDVRALSQRGPATPDHVIRTKRTPLVGRDVDDFASDYRKYFLRHAARQDVPPTMLDSAPRIVLDPELGLLAAGANAAGAYAAADLYAHTAEIILRAEALEEWQALPEADVFDVEYWELEQAKLGRDRRRPFEGEIALVTGAASGIGRAIARHFLDQGAAVVGIDVDAAVSEVADLPAYRGLVCDLTAAGAAGDAVEWAVDEFGGVDMLILNAGIFPPSTPIDSLGVDDWRRTFAINTDANLELLREAFPMLARAPRGGRVVVNASKNVPAPGPGAAAYSASKAALTQLARVAALEWGASGVRVNVLHPNGVFDTGVWSPELLEQRAAAYGMSVDRYRSNNVLGVEVTSSDVARAAAALCGDAFSKTTGAQVPVDGGNERVI